MGVGIQPRQLLNCRVRNRDRCIGVVGDLRVVWVPGTADVVRDYGLVNRDVTRVIIAHEEDCTAEGIDLVVLDARPAQ